MRIKKVPPLTKVIIFTNESEKDCVIYLERNPFFLVPANSRKYIDCRSFFCQMPAMKQFPTWQFYSNIKIKVEFTK